MDDTNENAQTVRSEKTAGQGEGSAKENFVEVIFVIDKSGSMSGTERDIVGGFNTVIEEQKKLPGKVAVSTVFFDAYRRVLHNRALIDTIRPMTVEDYQPNGTTALLDAVGFALHHIGHIHRDALPDQVPDKTLVIIMTDGYENASRYYTEDKVRHDIRVCREKYGWEFRFFGANIESGDVAEAIGIERDCAEDFLADGEGIGRVYENVCCCMRAVREMPPRRPRSPRRRRS